MSTDVQDRPVAAPAPTPAAEADASSGSGLTFEAIAVISMVIAFAAVVTSIFALGLAARSIDEHRAIPEGGASGGGPVAVALDEFTISPAPITVSAGGALTVSNEGTTTHDLTVEGQELTTGTLDAGASGELDLSSLDAGTYTVFCSIPGHRESGMEDEVTIG